MLREHHVLLKRVMIFSDLLHRIGDFFLGFLLRNDVAHFYDDLVFILWSCLPYSLHGEFFFTISACMIRSGQSKYPMFYLL